MRFDLVSLYSHKIQEDLFLLLLVLCFDSLAVSNIVFSVANASTNLERTQTNFSVVFKKISLPHSWSLNCLYIVDVFMIFSIYSAYLSMFT